MSTNKTQVERDTPRIQHHTAEEGPPSSNGVLNVVAILLHMPYSRLSVTVGCIQSAERTMILNAKLIVARFVLEAGSDLDAATKRDNDAVRTTRA